MEVWEVLRWYSVAMVPRKAVASIAVRRAMERCGLKVRVEAGDAAVESRDVATDDGRAHVIIADRYRCIAGA